MKRQLHAEEDDSYLYNRIRKVRDHPLSLVENSTTLPTLMYEVALYRDQDRRIYRPRVALTEQENGRPTEKEVSERIVCFDCYLLPRMSESKIEHLSRVATREQRMENARKRKGFVEKGTVPEVGEKIKFGLYKPLAARDTETVREWEGKVIQVNWGTVLRWTKEEQEVVEPNWNSGFVKIQVIGTYDRSLVANPESMVERTQEYLPA